MVFQLMKQPPRDKDCVFRYEDEVIPQGYMDEFDNWHGVNRWRTRINLIKIPIEKRTRCGVWINWWGFPKFINLNARKQFASETPERALECLYYRRKRQVKMLKAQLERAEIGLIAIKEKRDENSNDGDTRDMQPVSIETRHT